MSKEKQSVREAILDKALQMFNTQGVENTGVRELAKALNLKGGNITYYFPAKNDIIKALAEALALAVQKITSVKREDNIYEFLQLHKEVYHCQYQYRGLMISIANLQQERLLSHLFEEGQLLSRKVIFERLKAMLIAGHIRSAKVEELDGILNAVTMANRFWIAEALVDNLLVEPDMCINLYLKRFAGILALVATEKGKEDIRRFLKII